MGGPSDHWQAVLSGKKASHGDTNAMHVGGPGPHIGELEFEVGARAKASDEPAFYHSPGELLR